MLFLCTALNYVGNHNASLHPSNRREKRKADGFSGMQTRTNQLERRRERRRQVSEGLGVGRPSQNGDVPQLVGGFFSRDRLGGGELAVFELIRLL